MKYKILINRLLIGTLIACCSYTASAAITVDKSQGKLTITPDINGLVVVKVIDPDNVMVVDEQYQGNSFSWSPSVGPDGAYRYDVRMIDHLAHDSDQKDEKLKEESAIKVTMQELV